MAYSRTTHKRTVRCGYCRASGHNKAGCPDYKQKIQERRASNPHDWRVQDYDEKKARRSRKGKDRTCSYCGGKGHNRATCPDLKQHIFESKVKNATFRAHVRERFEALGIGVGAILSSDRNKQRVDREDYDSPTYRVPQVVTGICWDNINYWNKTYSYFDDDCPLLTKPISDLTKRHPNQMGWPWDTELLKVVMDEDSATQWLGGSHWRYDEKACFFCDVESPVPPTTPPDKWLDGGDLKFFKKAFKKRQSFEGAL